VRSLMVIEREAVTWCGLFMKRQGALPAYGDLDHAMKLAERETRRHLNAPPHHRADPGQPDFDLQDRRRIRREVFSPKLAP
jgi:hypothetical protein